MEFTNDQLIDTALNLAGYLAAALFSLVIYSIYFGRKISNLEDAVRCAAGWNGSPGFDESVAVSDLEEGDRSAIRRSRFPSEMDGGAVSKRNERSPEFLDLSLRENLKDDVASGASHYNGTPDRFARNRSEVIRLARKMLEAGNTVDRVSGLLPISESEMRLVQMGSQAKKPPTN